MLPEVRSCTSFDHRSESDTDDFKEIKFIAVPCGFGSKQGNLYNGWSSFGFLKQSEKGHLKKTSPCVSHVPRFLALPL